MTLKEAIVKAVTENDCKKLGRIVEHLRFQKGLDYKGCYQFINRCKPISEADFEVMMQETE